MTWASAEPRVSGAVILDQLEYLSGKFGEELYGRALARLAENERRELEELLPISWVRSSTAQRFKDHLATLAGLTSGELQVQVVQAALARTIHVFWRLLLRQLSSAALVKRTPILYAKTFDRGALIARVLGEGGAEFALQGCPEMSDYDALGLATGITCVMEHAGRTGASTRWRREGRGMVFETSWTVETSRAAQA